MDKFKDGKGKESMMRRMTWLIVIVSLVWGSIEIIYSLFVNSYIMHSAFIISVLTVGVTGKIGQKIFEQKKGKDEEV